jgi:hypothetical protein
MQGKERVSTGDSSRLGEYGLDSAQIRHVEWRADGKTVRISLGKTSGTDYSSTYWRWADKPDVYRTPGNFNWELGGRLTEWKDRSLFKIEAKDLRSVEVAWRDSVNNAFHYTLEMANDSTLKLVKPDSALVKKESFTEITNRGFEFQIDDFVAAEDTNLAKVKLDTPMTALKFNLKNGKSHELKTSRTFDGMVYAEHPERRDTVKIGSWRFDMYRVRPFELAAPDTASAPPATAPEKAGK